MCEMCRLVPFAFTLASVFAVVFGASMVEKKRF
jgi:hypothetical protein